MKEEDTVTLPAYSLVDRSYNELLDEQFDKGLGPHAGPG